MNLQPPAGRRPHYDEAFRLEALRRWKTTRRSAGSVARELGISPATLYSWGHNARTSGSEASVAATTQLMAAMELELVRLRHENERLRQQREILKRSLAIISETSRGTPLWASPEPLARSEVHPFIAPGKSH